MKKFSQEQCSLEPEKIELLRKKVLLFLTDNLT